MQGVYKKIRPKQEKKKFKVAKKGTERVEGELVAMIILVGAEGGGGGVRDR